MGGQLGEQHSHSSQPRFTMKGETEIVGENNTQNPVQEYVVYCAVWSFMILPSLPGTSEKQSFLLFFFSPCAIVSFSHSLPRKAANTSTMDLLCSCIEMCFDLKGGEVKKKIAVIVDVFRSYSRREPTSLGCGEKKRRMVVYRVRFHFSFLPSFAYLLIYSTSIFCVLLLGRSQLKSEDLQE